MKTGTNWLYVVMGFLAVTGVTPAQPAGRPNVVIIVADDKD